MRIIFFAAILAASTFAADVNPGALVSGEFHCNLKEKGKHLEAGKYVIRYEAKKDTRTVSLTHEEGTFLKALHSEHSSAFLVEEGDLYPEKNFGYLYFDLESSKVAKLTLATKISQGVYENDRLECKTKGKLVFAKQTRVRRYCETTKPFLAREGKPVTHEIELVLNHLGEPFDEYELHDVKVSPDESYAAALLENTSFAQNEEKIAVGGDSDGFYLVKLVLYRDSDLRAGFLRTEAASSEIPEDYSTVKCTKTKP